MSSTLRVLVIGFRLEFKDVRSALYRDASFAVVSPRCRPRPPRRSPIRLNGASPYGGSNALGIAAIDRQDTAVKPTAGPARCL